MNKADSEMLKDEELIKQFGQLGLGPIYPISSIHGEGVGDMLDEATKDVEVINEDDDEDEFFGKTRKQKRVEKKQKDQEEKELKAKQPGMWNFFEIS